MNRFTIDMSELRDFIPQLHSGDKVSLSGVIFTARDAAHLRLMTLLDNGCSLPFDIRSTVLYYAGPSPEKPDGQIGSFGPTTSARMDRFSPRLLDLGLPGMIGKGERNSEVVDAIVRNRSVYFCACGGLGALISKSIISSEAVAFPELGCESIKKLVVKEFPLIVAVDSYGNSIFDRNYG